MKGVPRSPRQILPPQAVDERVDGDHPAVPEREHRQQRLTLRAAHVRRRPARENLERAEQPDFEQLLHTRLASSAESRTLERLREAQRFRRRWRDRQRQPTASQPCGRARVEQPLLARSPACTRTRPTLDSGSPGHRPRHARADRTRDQTWNVRDLRSPPRARPRRNRRRGGDLTPPLRFGDPVRAAPRQDPSRDATV